MKKFFRRNSLFFIGCMLYNTCTAFTFDNIDIETLTNAIQTNQISCEEVIKHYIDRIKQYNLIANYPLNAITQINPLSLEQARELDKTFKLRGELRGVLHCVPTILKDNLDSFDTITSSGSFSLIGNQPNRDADLVKQLRDAGAIILAKGGMDEFAWGMVGISSRSGRIGNAYNAAENPGGSSGGVAVAVAANFAVIGIGTDNSGSVRIPAAFNGLAGLRPSAGLVSQRGIFPMGNLDGAAGPITRNIKDLAIVLDVIAKPHSSKKSYTNFLNENALSARRIAIVHKVGNIDTFRNMTQEMRDLHEHAIDKMKSAGAIFLDLELPKFINDRKYNDAGEIEDVDTYLAAFPATRKNFKDICTSDRTRTFGTVSGCLKYIMKMPGHRSKEYANVLKTFSENKKYVEEVMQKNNIDVLLLPLSTHGSATYDEMSVNTWRAPVSSNTGLPALTFNIGYDQKNMPVGLEIIAKQFDEAMLISIAYAYEKKFSQYKAPTLGEANYELMTLNIAQLNNLYTLIGAMSYERKLSKSKDNTSLPKLLTASDAKQIVKDAMAKSSSSSWRGLTAPSRDKPGPRDQVAGRRLN